MKLLPAFAGLVLLLGAAGAQAQIYKWVDDRGVTHLSDTPPPPNAKKVEQKAGGAGDGGVALPYELAQAVRNFPVTLYTTSPCGACDQGRSLLNARGIPYTEKTVSNDDDQARLAEAGSVGQLPLLVVGNSKQIGFEAGAWNSALDVASYPAKKMLPSNYKQAKAETAAVRGPTPEQLRQAEAEKTAAAAAARAEAAAAAAAESKRKAEQGNKPAFQF